MTDSRYTQVWSEGQDRLTKDSFSMVAAGRAFDAKAAASTDRLRNRFETRFRWARAMRGVAPLSVSHDGTYDMVLDATGSTAPYPI